MISWKFAQNKLLKIENFARNFKDEETNVYGLAVLYFIQKTWTFCNEASLPFPGEWTGIVA